MRVPLIVCLNTHQLLPQGQGLGVATNHSKSIPAPSWKSIHAGGQGPEGSVYHEAHKGGHSMGLLPL